MDAKLSTFITTRGHLHVSCSTPLKTLADHFRRTLEPSERNRWPRTRLVSELSQQFKLTVDAAGRWTVIGLGLAA
jgi:hypothetical protein